MKNKIVYCMLIIPCIIQGMNPERLRLLEHLVVNNDMPLLMSLKDAHGVMPDHIKNALTHLSVKHKKPQVLIVACAQTGLADSVALIRWATQQEDLTLEQVDVYYDALDLIKKREKHRASAVHKALSQGSLANKKLPRDIQNACKAYFPTSTHPLKPDQMHPALEKAITEGNLDRVKALIDQGYNLHASTNDYMDALELATHHGKAAIFRELIKHMPYINPHKQKVLSTYAQGEMIPVITKELPEYIDKKDQEISDWDCPTSRMLALLHSGANPNAQRDYFGATPLITTQPSLARLKILLRQGADANSYIPILGYSMAERAMYRDEPRRLKTLLEHGADHNGRNGRPLAHIAISLEQPQCLQVLLEQGANPNSTWNGHSLLCWAEFSRQKKELIPLLKKYGAQYTTLEKYPEIENIPLGILYGLLAAKAVDAQITVPLTAGIVSVSVLTSMAMRAIKALRNT